jgi:hypothetical protein
MYEYETDVEDSNCPRIAIEALLALNLKVTWELKPMIKQDVNRIS